MYDFLSHNSLYVVLLIVSMIWCGLFAYLWRIDHKVKNLEQHRKG